MSKVFLHQAGKPDRLLGHISEDGRVIRSVPGPDDEIGHVDLATGKIYARKLGPDEYLGRVDLENGKVYRHVALGSDEYLGRAAENGRMYRHVPAAADDYIGSLPGAPSYAHSGAAFLLLVLPYLEATD
jgi:hypothetical protein